MRQPRRGKVRENKFNQVQKGGLDIAGREIGGPQMLAYFGTDMDRGEGTVRVDEDGVEGVSVEWSDKEGCLSLLKISPPHNSAEEVGVNEFFSQVPDVVTLFVDD